MDRGIRSGVFPLVFPFLDVLAVTFCVLIVNYVSIEVPLSPAPCPPLTLFLGPEQLFPWQRAVFHLAAPRCRLLLRRVLAHLLPSDGLCV
jgi:hypothetical protein